MNKKDYLFVIDLDGTLLPRSKEIPPESREYIQNLVADGFNIILASGRPTHNIYKFYQELKLNSPIIALNGLHLHFPYDENKDEHIYLKNETVLNISNDVAKKYEIENIICETDKEIYLTNKESYLDSGAWLKNMIVTYGPIESNLKNQVMTFLIVLKDKNFNESVVKSIINSYPHMDCRFWVGAYRGFVEIFDTSVNKKIAIQRIAKLYNVKEDNIYFFGDDANDLEAIRYFKNAYAMKNSFNCALEIAHNITKEDNENQGVIVEIKSILKNLK